MATRVRGEKLLTASQVRAAKAGAGKSLILSDGGGLSLLVTKGEGYKHWQYRFTFAKKQRLSGLGSFPKVSLEQARLRRDVARDLVARGINPIVQKRDARATPSDTAEYVFERIALNWYESWQAKRVPSHATRNLQRIKLYLLPLLGTRDIRQISTADVSAVIAKIVDAHKPETARRVLQICSMIFRYAVNRKLAPVNITRDVEFDADDRGESRNHAAITEPKEIGPLLRAIHGYKGSEITRAALKLAPLVFVRPGELRTAKWEEINLETSEWRFLASKTKQPHIVPLSTQAVAILRELKSASGDGVYVFPNPRDASRPMSENAVLAALRRMEFEKDEMTGHGFRAMARTVLDEVLQFPPEIIEHQLAHAVRGPLGRAYNRTTHLPQRHAMMQTWADYLDTLRADVSRKAA
jgi:integrase